MSDAASFARYVRELAGLALEGRAAAPVVLAELHAKASRVAERGAGAGPSFTRDQIARAVKKYRITHWGAKGSGRARAGYCADPAREPLVALGKLVQVTYQTTKDGDPPGTWYTHDFSRPLPELAYSSGGLVVVGGGYRVTVRGIVG